MPASIAPSMPRSGMSHLGSRPDNQRFGAGLPRRRGTATLLCRSDLEEMGMADEVTAAQRPAAALPGPLRARLRGRAGWLLGCGVVAFTGTIAIRSEEHTSEVQS